MDSRQPLDTQAIGLMLVLCLIWSMQQIALKATAADISPILQIALRSGIGAALVGLFMRARGEPMPFSDGAWRPGLVVGCLFALEYLLVGQGLRFTSASHTVVFLYTAPIFAALGLHWKLPSERLAPLQWVGIALAFGGIAAAFLGRSHQGATGGLSSTLLGDLLALAAGAAWGATTVVIRTTRLSGLPAAQTLLYQLVAAFVLLLAGAAVLGQTTFHPTPLAWASLAFQSVIVSFASFLAWFWLLRHYLASRLGVFSFMTPLFGIVLGAWLLNEPIDPSFLTGALLVLAGIVLVSGYGLLKQLTGTLAAQR
ncbi:DMT family transporter [Crenobacter sp. SG2303]|uniref:DMT family transporter n=1 Tax=Crenobacter oryzisoli TaxID=3056844 RepID=A0ABT7XUJ1_9NEIS|nr:DMT family transporter [Crenobacter sp. SG2303]MDN0077463.1 DMT family transporter [Crenobacter sp. SG2303]